MLFPASEDYYSSLAFDKAPLYSISNSITDGFIVSARDATFDPPTSALNAYTTEDANDSTSIVYGGISPAGDGTWAGFVENTPLDPQPAGRPGGESLQLDIEFRFTDGGSVATYFNASVSVIDTILLPFEVWSVEEDRQLNAAIYMAAGSKPVHEADADNPGERVMEIGRASCRERV